VQAKLTETSTALDTTQQQAAPAQRDLALVTEAWKAPVSPAKMDYLRFLASQDAAFAEIDPAAPDAGAKVASTIAALVAKDPTLRTTGSAGASGAAGYGGAGEPTQITQEQFDAMPLDKRTELYHSD